MARVLVLTIILIILLGGVYFYENTRIPPNQKEKTASIKQLILPQETEEKNGLQLKNFFPQLFSGLGIKKDQETPGENESEKAENKEVDAATAKLKLEIKNYLIQSSNINFPQDQAQLQFALSQTENNNPADLMKIRDEYKAKLELFKQLSPPKELFEIHDKSTQIIQNFINLLDDTIHQTKGSVQETWDSQERLNIINEANKVKISIIEIVNRYNIDLPADVLPY